MTGACSMWQAIKEGKGVFHRPRRTGGVVFYERCIPERIIRREASPIARSWFAEALAWSAPLPDVTPQGTWDWFVFSSETSLFWRSMAPVVDAILGRAIHACGLTIDVTAPVLHFRCASTPFNRQSQYHFQRYAYYAAAARRYRRRLRKPLRRLHVLTCVSDEFKSDLQARSCAAYLDDLLGFLRSRCALGTAMNSSVQLQTAVSLNLHFLWQPWPLSCAALVRAFDGRGLCGHVSGAQGTRSRPYQ